MEIEFDGPEVYIKLDENSIRRCRFLLLWLIKSNQIKRKYSVNPIVEQRSVFGISFFITFLS